jgi:hypothetical protein
MLPEVVEKIFIFHRLKLNPSVCALLQASLWVGVFTANRRQWQLGRGEFKAARNVFYIN